jgi:hypothetical protein
MGAFVRGAQFFELVACHGDLLGQVPLPLFVVAHALVVYGVEFRLFGRHLVVNHVLHLRAAFNGRKDTSAAVEP